MKSRTLFLAGVLSLSLVSVVSAQATRAEGTVVSSSGSTLVISTPEGQRTFHVDSQSSLPSGGLAVGSRVTVDYHTMSDNVLHASRVSPFIANPSGTTGATTPSLGTTTSGTASDGTRPSGTTTTAPTGTMGSTPSGTTTPRTTGTTTEPSMGTTQATTPSTPLTGTTTDTRTDTTTTAPMTADATSETLPATASPLPLIALGGTLALAAGLFLRRQHA
jgi:hypothetical protein